MRRPQNWVDERFALISSTEDHRRQIGVHWPTPKEQMLFLGILSKASWTLQDTDAPLDERIGEDLAPTET